MHQPQLDQSSLTFVLAPGTAPLSRVLSTARARQIRVNSAIYLHDPDPDPDRDRGARLVLEIAADRAAAERAARQLDRLVDVVSVAVTT